MGIFDHSQLPNLDLFGIFSFHFGFTTWALTGLGLNYLFYNLIFLIVLVWCVKDTQNEIPLILAIRINILSILFDFFILLWCLLVEALIHTSIFCLLGLLFNLALRFVTTPLLSKFCSDKTGGLNDGLPPALTPIFGVEPGSVREPYENLDSSRPHQSYPKGEGSAAGSYNFGGSNASQYQQV